MEDKICGYILDKEQQNIVLDDSNHLLVVAGAGSGKTLTILGKIYYLIKYKFVNPNEIICISFTRASANDLKNKIKREFDIEMDVYTFHALALKVIKQYKQYEVAPDDALKFVIDEFFSQKIFTSIYHLKLLFKFLKIKDIKEYNMLNKNNDLKIVLLKNNIERFIKLFKVNDFKLQDFVKFLSDSKKTFLNFSYRKEKIFLNL